MDQIQSSRTELQKIVDKVAELNESIRNVESNSQEQMSFIKHINGKLSVVQAANDETLKVAQSTLDHSKDLKDHSVDLSGLADDLIKTVNGKKAA